MDTHDPEHLLLRREGRGTVFCVQSLEKQQHTMGLGVCTSKAFLVLLSLLFLAAAAALAYVGINIIVTYKQYENFLNNVYVMLPAIIILGTAVFMFIIGLVGCVSAIQESCCGLGCFITLISIMFAAGVVVLVLGLVYKDKINPELQKNMNVLFEKYDGKNVESSAVDFIQEELQCCGIRNYSSWENTTWFHANHTVPVSCCRKNETDCQGKLDALNKINTEGCEEKLETVLNKVLGFSMLVILGFAVIEIDAAALCFVGANIIYTYKEFEGILNNSYVMKTGIVILIVASVKYVIGLVGCSFTIDDDFCCSLPSFTIIADIIIAILVIVILDANFEVKINPEVNPTPSEKSFEEKLQFVMRLVFELSRLLVYAFTVIEAIALIGLTTIQYRNARGEYERLLNRPGTSS